MLGCMKVKRQKMNRPEPVKATTELQHQDAPLPHPFGDFPQYTNTRVGCWTVLSLLNHITETQ